METRRGWRRRWEQRFGVDLRSLALFRILIGLLLLVDLATRLPSLRAFSRDAGSGLWGLQLVLLAIAALCALCAICLIIGHRTRLFTVLSWLLLLALPNRNVAALNAGDALLCMLLFWSIFLPIGARGSVDSAMNAAAVPDSPECSDRYWSVPVFCFMAQVSIVYWATALLKHDPVPEDSTSATRFVELAAPMLIWVPFFVGPLRLLTVILMVGMHLTFAATRQIGLFSYVCCAMWLALLPPWIWDRLFAQFRRDPRRLGLTMHYDGDCGFCRRMVLVVRSFFLLPETRIARAQDDADIERDMREHNSWVVTDHEQHRHYKFEAVTFVLRRSPWAWPVGALLHLRPARRIGTWLYEWVADHRGLMGRLTGWMRPRPIAPRRRGAAVWLRDAVLLAALAYVVVWPARGNEERISVFEPTHAPDEERLRDDTP